MAFFGDSFFLETLLRLETMVLLVFISVVESIAKSQKMSFPIFIRQMDGEMRSIDIPVGSSVKSIKDELDEDNETFDLVYAGEDVKASQIEPNMELEMVINQKNLAKKRVDDLIQYTSFNSSVMEGSKYVRFPLQTGININMMPFIPDKPQLIPEEYHGYLPLIDSCWGLDRSEVCYLTIQESFVKSGTSQRKPGLHIETPGTIANLHPKHRCGFGRSYELSWGGGTVCEGGIYMATSVPNSCRMYDVRIKDKEAVGRHGDISHLRNEIDLACERRLERKHDVPIKTVKPNKVYWFTDCTPHEALPLMNDTNRQFFRVVSHHVNVWFEDHSTANPLGVVPPDTVKVLKGSKFEDF